MTTETPILKRSLKRLADTAIEHGWDVEPSLIGDAAVVVMTLPDADIPEPADTDYRTRRYLSVRRVRISGSPETGALYGTYVTDLDGNVIGAIDTDTIADVENLLRFRKRYVDDHAAKAERDAAELIRAAERAAVREVFIDRIADDYKYLAIKTLAESAETPLEIDTSDGRGLYWAAGAMTNHLTAALRKRMAVRALNIVGWPEGGSDRPGDVGTPMPLGTAIAKSVAEIISHESSASADYEALAAAAKDVLRYA